MRFNYLNYTFDFDAMMMYRCLEARKEDMLYDRKNGVYKIEDINSHLNFLELKLRKKQLSLYVTNNKAWMQVFVGDEQSRKLDKMYCDYIFEKSLLLNQKTTT